MSTDEQLAAVIKGMPVRLRTVLVMSEIQHKSRAEIAAELRISPRRVERRMARALKACRDRLYARGIELAASQEENAR